MLNIIKYHTKTEFSSLQANQTQNFKVNTQFNTRTVMKKKQVFNVRITYPKSEIEMGRPSTITPKD